MVYGNPEVTTGGQALKYYASVRIDVRKVAQLGTGDEVYGNHVRCKVVKNKVAPPFRTAEFDIIYGKGISKESEIIELGVKCGILEKSGGWLSYNGEKLGNGKDKVRTVLCEDKQLAEELEEKIKAYYRGNPEEIGGPDAPEADPDAE